MARKAVMTRDGTRTRPTNHQYAVLRFWAARPLVLHGERPPLGPPPVVTDRTRSILCQRGWVTDRPRWLGVEGLGFVVLDRGRAAVGLAPLGLDQPCPVPRCDATVGERCMDGTGVPVQEAGRLYWPYTDRIHEVRSHRALYLALRDEHPLDTHTQTGERLREVLTAQAAAQAARAELVRAAEVGEHLRDALASLGVDPHGAVGLIHAT